MNVQKAQPLLGSIKSIFTNGLNVLISYEIQKANMPIFTDKHVVRELLTN